ncbi:MAG: hypothetical protein ACRDHG_12765 [Anaerolineales bacterium]
MPIARYPNGTLPARVHSKTGKPVLLQNQEQAIRLQMLLIATDRLGRIDWRIGTNENGWWFCFRPDT